MKKEISIKARAPAEYRILRELEGNNGRVYVAENRLDKVVVILQTHPSKDLFKFYRLFFNKDKCKRRYLKYPNIRSLLTLKAVDEKEEYIAYQFEGEWPIKYELQSHC